MKKGIYLIRDVVSGSYEFFGTFVNDGVALREFRKACNEAGTVYINDLELYCASRLDSDTGRICHITDDVYLTGSPTFLMKGENNEVSN